MEFRDAEKQFNKQRVVAEGDGRDPLRIGQGPLPLPFHPVARAFFGD